ncbi:MAG: type II toxin-antitoxin system RelE/ParE family toxin [bacterium]|nr:type II toxin-antitoxin system RelE/ParE family toxin [bacterium]
MPSLKKLLSRFNRKEKEAIELLLEKVISRNWGNLDIKKLKGYHDIFRLRKGDLRIIYRVADKRISILNIANREEATYKL